MLKKQSLSYVLFFFVLLARESASGTDKVENLDTKIFRQRMQLPIFLRLLRFRHSLRKCILKLEHNKPNSHRNLLIFLVFDGCSI